MHIDDLGDVKPIPDKAREVFKGEIFTVWQWQQELYNGEKATFEALTRPDAVHTIGVLPDKSILLTYDEQPNRGKVLTPAGGKVESNEALEVAAKREFLEETGYAIGDLRFWHSYQASTKMVWHIHAFIGRDLTHQQAQDLEAGEKIEVVTYSFDEFLQLGHNPKLRDRMLRILLLEALLDSSKRQELEQLLYG